MSIEESGNNMSVEKSASVFSKNSSRSSFMGDSGGPKDSERVYFAPNNFPLIQE